MTNSYDKEKKVTYWNPKVFDFEMADGAGGNSGGRSSSGSSRRREQEAYEGENEADDDGLPF